jgi:alkylhydroperoxidase family enzyme
VVRNPSALVLPPRERALAGLATVMTEAPWTVGDEDLDRLRAAGVSDEGIVQAVTIAAIFNHLTRVASGTGVEPDYASPLPRMRLDWHHAGILRPDAAEWPKPPAAPRLQLALRPATREAIEAWSAYAQTPSEALPSEDRAVIRRAVANGLCDAAGVAAWGDAQPNSARQGSLVEYAEVLTVMPWRIAADDLDPLRQLGFDDRGLLDVIGLVGFQNMESRLRLALG